VRSAGAPPKAARSREDSSVSFIGWCDTATPSISSSMNASGAAADDVERVPASTASITP